MRRFSQQTRVGREHARDQTPGRRTAVPAEPADEDQNHRPVAEGPKRRGESAGDYVRLRHRRPDQTEERVAEHPETKIPDAESATDAVQQPVGIGARGKEAKRGERLERLDEKTGNRIFEFTAGIPDQEGGLVHGRAAGIRKAHQSETGRLDGIGEEQRGDDGSGGDDPEPGKFYAAEEKRRRDGQDEGGKVDVVGDHNKTEIGDTKRGAAGGGDTARGG